VWASPCNNFANCDARICKRGQIVQASKNVLTSYIYSHYNPNNPKIKEGQYMKLAKELEQLKYELGILQEVDCSDEENEKYRKLLQKNEPLPNGILHRNPDSSTEYASFYKVEKTVLSKDELSNYIQYKQLKTLTTIKNCVVFFTVLTVISLIFGFFAVMSSF
jgi:hypothetical protein